MKVAVVGVFSWSLFSFAAVNISVQLLDDFFMSLLVSSFFCSALNSFFLLSFYRFKVTTNRRFYFSVLFVVLFLLFQIFFDTLIVLRGNYTFGIYIIMGFVFFFWNMLFGYCMQYLSANVKR